MNRFRNLHSLPLCLLFILGGVATAFGQSSTSPELHDWEASGFAGGSFGGNFELSTPGDTVGSVRVVGIHYSSGLQLGARATNNLNNFWSTSLEYSFANQPLRFTNILPDVPSLSLSQNVHHITYNALYFPVRPEHRFRPYATAGTGAALFYITGGSKSDASALGLSLRDSWKFAFNWGGGFKFEIEDPCALIFEVRDQITGVPSYGLPRVTH